MPNRLILIGNTDAGKLYFDVDAAPSDKNSLFVDKDEMENPVDLVEFILNNPNISELRTTPFHEFLWSGMGGSLSDRWKRTFITRTQPVDESLIKNIEIKKKPKKRLKPIGKTNQAMAFKSLSFSNNFNMMPGSALGNRRASQRQLIGLNVKIIGPVRAGYDGDGDGFVDDGLPTMRPFIPGIDIAKIPVKIGRAHV